MVGRRGRDARGTSHAYGELSYTLARDGETVVMEIKAGVEIPAGGLIVDPPLPPGVTRVEVDGDMAPYAAGDRVVVRSLPSRVTWK